MAADVRRVDWFLETQLSRDGHEMWDPRDVATCEAQDGCLQQQWRLDSQVMLRTLAGSHLCSPLLLLSGSAR